MNRLLFLALIFPLISLGQKSKIEKKKDFQLIQPKLTTGIGFCIPEFYNLGYEASINYFAFSNKWVRIGPSFQLNNFYVAEKEWFKTNNTTSEKMSELGLNALFNVQFTPFKKSTFFIGLAPYIGYRMLNNRGSVKNQKVDLDLKWNYFIHLLDYGTRYTLGGFVDKKQRFGLEASLQVSNRGLFDKDPTTTFFNIGKPDYKSYIFLGLTYRIK